MSDLVDVTCRGMKVAERVKLHGGDGAGGFVELEAPLPVGTRIVIGGKDALVTGVVEQEAGAKSPPGMRFVWGHAKPAAKEKDKDKDKEREGGKERRSSRRTGQAEAVPEVPPGDENAPSDTTVMQAVDIEALGLSPEDTGEKSEDEAPSPEGPEEGGRRGKRRKKPNGR